MECRQVMRMLFESHDSEVSSGVRREIEEHLNSCRSCSLQSAAFREHIETLQSLPRLQAPPDFLQQLNKRLEKNTLLSQAAGRIQTLLTLKYSWEFMGVAATVVFLIFTYQAVFKSQRRPIQEGIHIAAPATPQVSPADSLVRKGGMDKADSSSPLSPDATPSSVQEDSNTASITIALNRTILREHRSKEALTNQPISSQGTASSPSKEIGAERKPQAPALRNSKPSALNRISANLIPAEINELIAAANGEVTRLDPGQEEGVPGVIVIRMPAENYANFLDHLKYLGNVTITRSIEPTHTRPNSPILLKLTLQEEGQ